MTTCNAADYRSDRPMMVNGLLDFLSTMPISSNPGDNRNDHLPVDELGPDDARRDPRSEKGITPQQPETMPRAEDDEETFARSPEFHDRRTK
jgi:hypothetical protein